MKKHNIILASIAFLCGCLGAITVASLRGKPNLPTPQAIQSALSNNAAVYFRAGVLCGAAVDRSRPGLTPGQLIGTSLSYFSTLGPDPYLVPEVTKMAKLQSALGQVKRTNEVTATNIVSAVSTNTP